MHLKLEEGHKTHLSHFHNFVSAYETNKETVDDLIVQINDALKVAKHTYESQVVDQDCIDHVFLVHPSGRLSLYRCCGTYEIVKD